MIKIYELLFESKNRSILFLYEFLNFNEECVSNSFERIFKILKSFQIVNVHEFSSRII